MRERSGQERLVTIWNEFDLKKKESLERGASCFLVLAFSLPERRKAKGDGNRNLGAHNIYFIQFCIIAFDSVIILDAIHTGGTRFSFLDAANLLC